MDSCDLEKNHDLCYRLGLAGRSIVVSPLLSSRLARRMLGVGEDLGGVAAASLPQQLMATLKRNKARILDLFRALDVNRDGIITQAEFQMGMGALGLQLSVKDVDYLFDVLDVSDDGQADFNELKALLQMKTLDDADSYGMAKVRGRRGPRTRTARARARARATHARPYVSAGGSTSAAPRAPLPAPRHQIALLSPRGRRSAPRSCRPRIGRRPTWTPRS